MLDDGADMNPPMAYVAPKDLLVVEGCPSSRQERSTHVAQYQLEHLQPDAVRRATERPGLKAQYARQQES